MKWEDRHTVLALCSLSFASYHAARQILPPAIPLIKSQMELSYAQAGFTVSAYDLGYASTLILGGYLADRLNRTTFIIGGLLWLSFTLLLTTTADGFWALAAYRVLTGLAFGTYFTAGVSLISSYFPKSARGSALGIHTGMGAGAAKMLAPLLAGLTIESLGWRPLIGFVAVVGLVAALGFGRLVKEPPRETHRALPLAALLGQIVTNRRLILLGLANAATISVAVNVYTFVPLYLVNIVGTSLAFGGYSIAILNGTAIPIVSLYGFLSDRRGRKPVVVFVSLALAVALPFFTYLRGDAQIVVGVLVMGMFVSAAFPIIITYVVDVTPVAHRSLAVGYVTTFPVLGGAIMQVVGGFISDYFGVTTVFPFLAALSALAAVFILPVRESAAVAGTGVSPS